MKYLVPAFAFLLMTSAFSMAYAQDMEHEQMPADAKPAAVMPRNDQASTQAEGEKKPDAKKEQVDNLDPVSGTVGPTDVSFYDLYERQIRYKKADKEFRQSIEARRVTYEQPNTDHASVAEKKLKEIYKKENEETMKAIAARNNGGKDDKVASLPAGEAVPPPPKPKDTRPVVPVGEPGDGMEKAPEKLKEQEEAIKQSQVEEKVQSADQKKTEAVKATEEKKIGTKELDVKETQQEGVPEKKVVVPEDAPDFEKSPFD